MPRLGTARDKATAGTFPVNTAEAGMFNAGANENQQMSGSKQASKTLSASTSKGMSQPAARGTHWRTNPKGPQGQEF